MIAQTLQYTSFDGLYPLLAEARFPDEGDRLPLVVVMHGYGGSRMDIVPELDWLAERGLFALGVDMRGYSDSAGRADSGGLEIMDIYSAVEYALEQYPDRLDPLNLNIWGYSGGGGNAISCAVRFPELFRQIVAFFPITDYAYWHDHNSDFTEHIVNWVGGSPSELPWAYACRNALRAVGNNPLGRLHLFWDQEEIICPKWMDEEYLRIAQGLGLSNVTAHITAPSMPEEQRYLHGYPQSVPGLQVAQEAFLLPEIMSPGPARPLEIAASGRFNVPGYLLTHSCEVWVGNGVEGTVDLTYELTDEVWSFELTPGEMKSGATVALKPARAPSALEVDGTPAALTTLTALVPPCSLMLHF